MFSYWIQRHDYSATDEVADVSLGEAVRAFQDFDWQAELEAYDEDDDSRNCPPGIGCHNGFDGRAGEGMLLHICFKTPDRVFFNFHHPVAGRLLGLIPTSRHEIHCVENLDRDEVPALLRLFFELRTEDILGMTG